MKKFTASIIIALITICAVAQKPNKNEQREKIKTLRVAYMSEKIGLTTNESEKFWPLYYQYTSQRRDVAHKMRDLYRRVESGTTNSDDLTLLFALQDQETNLMRSSAEKFKTVIPKEKVIKVFVAEENFKRFLMNQKK